MKKLITILMLMICFGSMMPCFANTKNAYFYSRRAASKVMSNDYNGAIADLTKAIQLNPKYIEAYALRAQIELTKGNNTAAIHDYTIVIRSNSGKKTLQNAYEGRGLAKCYSNDYNGAIADETKAIQLDITCADAFTRRGLAKYKRGKKETDLKDTGSAIEDYKTAINDFIQAKNLYQSQNNKKDADMSSAAIYKCYEFIQSAQSTVQPQSTPTIQEQVNKVNNDFDNSCNQLIKMYNDNTNFYRNNMMNTIYY